MWASNGPGHPGEVDACCSELGPLWGFVGDVWRSVWFFVGNGGMGYGNYYWGLLIGTTIRIHSPIPY